MTTKTETILPENVKACFFDFDGIEVEVRAVENKFKIVIYHGNIELDHHKLPEECRVHGISKVNDSWYYNKREDGVGFYFKNGDLVSSSVVNRILNAVKYEAAKLKEIRERKEAEAKIATSLEKLLVAEKKTSNHMWIKIVPTEDPGSTDVILSVEGMKKIGEVPPKYRFGKIACYAFSDGTYVVRSYGKNVFETNLFNIYGTKMPKAHAEEMVKVLGECAGTLYGINHPDFRGIITKM